MTVHKLPMSSWMNIQYIKQNYVKFMWQSILCGLTNSANVEFVHNLFTHSKTVRPSVRPLKSFLLWCIIQKDTS